MQYDINEYANCMFRNEKLPEPWIEQCAAYLRTQFPSIEGKVVMDYAFGRGNWALAFIKAGAKKVYAIDASIDNVKRFKEFSNKNAVRNIEIIHGNLLDQDFDFQCDLFWIYGILNHIEEFDIFIQKCISHASDENALFYIYHYNRGSLRQWVVEACRSLIKYSCEKEFIKDTFLYQRTSRIRARDDLTSFFIRWISAIEFQNKLRECGLFIYAQQKNFEWFLTGVENKEFSPYQVLCGFDKGKEICLREQSHYKSEIIDLEHLYDDLLKSLTKEQYKAFAVGLFNTHFSNLKFSEKDALIEDLLFMAHAIFFMTHTVNNATSVSKVTQEYMYLIKKSLIDVERSIDGSILEENLLTRYIVDNRVRI